MEEKGGWCYVDAANFNQDTGVHYNYKCLKCAESERQLKEMHLELSSLQLIIKLLYKEINSITSTYNMAGNTNTPSSSFSFNESGINAGSQKRWTVVPSNRHNLTRSQENSTLSQPLTTKNIRFISIIESQ
jgi:hypothetical protein